MREQFQSQLHRPDPTWWDPSHTSQPQYFVAPPQKLESSWTRSCRLQALFGKSSANSCEAWKHCSIDVITSFTLRQANARLSQSLCKPSLRKASLCEASLCEASLCKASLHKAIRLQPILYTHCWVWCAICKRKEHNLTPPGSTSKYRTSKPHWELGEAMGSYVEAEGAQPFSLSN